MKLLRGLKSLAVLEKGAAVTIGNFDGVHRGHQALIKQLCERARERHLSSVVLFFEPQPAEFFGTHAPVRLMSRQQKLKCLQQFPIDYVCCIKFDQKYASLPHEVFASEYLFGLFHAKYMLVGKDFRFGQHRAGSSEYLHHVGQTLGCDVEIFEDFIDNNARVSSTEIREALAEGDLTRAHTALGRPYSVYGRVIRGDGLAGLWGFPTANIWLKHQALALKGVFIVRVKVKQKMHWGVANVGYRPTVSGVHPRLEVHLFDFKDSLYYEHIEVFFIAQLRHEQKFSSVDALIAQIHQDCEQAKMMIQEWDE